MNAKRCLSCISLVTAAIMAGVLLWWGKDAAPASSRVRSTPQVQLSEETAGPPSRQGRKAEPTAPVAGAPAPVDEPSPAPAAAAPVVRVDPEVLRRRFRPAPAAARLPLVFALPPEEMPGLNERQAAAAIAIAEQFAATIGGEDADPSTPDYRDRWKREQPLADYQLRAAIGAQAYARWQEEAYLRAKAAAQ